MSCNCKNTEGVGANYACQCDELIHPLPLNIGAGLSHLPRQIAHFPEFRRAMLASLNAHPALYAWRARKEDDLGVMLLEMWAYICDSLSFYDEVLADEAYLRTAQLCPSLRRLIALIGYRPSPAVASKVTLATFADGRIPVKLPAGTSFRSGAFDGNPPQVFELDNDTWIHPLTNKWAIKPPFSAINNPVSSLLVSPQGEVKHGSVFLLLAKNSRESYPFNVNLAEPTTGKDGKTYTKLVLMLPSSLNINSPFSDFRVLKATQSVGLWTLDNKGLTGVSNELILKNTVPNINIDDAVVVTSDMGIKWFRITGITEVMVKNELSTDTITVNNSTFKIPAVSTPVTKITLSGTTGSTLRSAITVHFGLQDTGSIYQQTKTTLVNSDPLDFAGIVETPVDRVNLTCFLLQDKNLRAHKIGASLSFLNRNLVLDNAVKPPDTVWQSELTLPVDVFGNLVEATRGERVDNEILGNGNAMLPNQTFKLKKKPLTYLTDSKSKDDRGIANTLKIWVNGIEWSEVAHFYGKKPSDQVYIVRQDDEHESFVTFGDGIRGERLPSGAEIVGTYRFGAEKASPPAGSINQIGKPVKGLQSVKSPLPAVGGADAETADGMRTFAPKSALILGRIVSIQDMEAVALSFPCVRTAKSEWAWDSERLQAVANIWYIGNIKTEELCNRLNALSDPTTTINVKQATPTPITLTIAIDIDPRFQKEKVLAAVHDKLMNAQTGRLRPEQIGIGKPLFRSQLFAAVLAVEGTKDVKGISWGSTPLSNFAVKPPEPGNYFDISTTINQ